jgi:O-methyltransferase
MSRQEIIQNEMSSILLLEGDMAEIGVYKGHMARVLHNKAPHKILHLYDTFKGIAKSDPSVDVHGNGEFADTSPESVKNYMGGESNFIKYYVGIFPDTFVEDGKKSCFVYSDTDTYFGSKSTLNIFSRRMVSGGKIMFDDYGWKGCPGVEKAITEFLKINSNLKTSLNDSQFTITF